MLLKKKENIRNVQSHSVSYRGMRHFCEALEIYFLPANSTDMCPSFSAGKEPSDCETGFFNLPKAHKDDLLWYWKKEMTKEIHL